MISKNTGDVKKDTLLKNKRGITLIALIVTIVVMLILATVTIGAINGGLFDYARKGKVQAEIVDLKEQLEKKKIMSKTNITDGEINTILGIDSQYNDSLAIENGELVYIKNKWSTSDIASLEEMGIKARLYDVIVENTSTVYYIAMPSTKTAKYANLTNVGTLENFRDMANAGTFTYDEARLIEDIKLNEGKYTITNGEIEFSEDATQWIPIGKNRNLFNKLFDGQNHTISGLYYNNTDVAYVGLFTQLVGGTIQNLGVINSKIIGKQHVGGIVGYINPGSVLNSYVKNSFINAASGSVGGIVGIIWGTTAEVKDCYNIGTKVSASNSSAAGGICGGSKGRVERCFNNGNMEGRIYIGGIVGSNQSSGKVFNCYNIGEAESSSNNESGGIAGTNAGKIINCYTTSNVLKGTAENSYYLVESVSENASAKIASQMKAQAFVTQLNTITTTTTDEETGEETTTTATQDVWAVDTKNINNGFPILKWQK